MMRLVRIRTIRCMAAVAAMVSISAASAGTIRHDRSDHAHLAGAKSPKLAAVVPLLVEGSPSCSGTLIAPQWVLTATHCIWPHPLAPPFANQTIVVGKQRFNVGPRDIFIHPDWLTGGFDVGTTSGDIALIRLPRRVTAVSPIRINRQRNEVGDTAYMAGFGTTGTGLTGNTIRTSVKRAGMNVIDATVATVSFSDRYPLQQAITIGSSRALLTDFDDPIRDASTLGTIAPLNLEYTTAQGDSGGPLLIYRDRVFTVAGVTSGGIDGFAGTTGAYSFYSDVATFTRVSSYRDWLNGVMSGNGRNLEDYFAILNRDAGAAIRVASRAIQDREAELRRRGLRLQARTWLGQPTSPGQRIESRASLPGETNLVSDMLGAIERRFAGRGNTPVNVPFATTTEDASFPEVTFSGCACGSPSDDNPSE